MASTGQSSESEYGFGLQVAERKIERKQKMWWFGHRGDGLSCSVVNVCCGDCSVVSQPAVWMATCGVAERTSSIEGGECDGGCWL